MEKLPLISRIAQTPLAQHRALGASLACFWTFHFIVLWSSTFAISGPQGPFGLSNDFTWVLSIVCNVAALLICYLRMRKGTAANFDRLAALASFGVSAGIAFIALRAAYSGLLFDEFHFAGTVLFGAGTGLLMACYAVRLSNVTPQTTFMLFAAAFFIGAVLCLLVSSALVLPAAWAATALLPLATAYFYCRSSEAQPVAESPAPAMLQSSAAGLPTKSLFVLISIIGLTAGLVRGTSYETLGTPPPDFLFIGSVMAGGAILFVLSFFANRLKPTLFLQVIVVIISGAFLAGALLAGPSSPIAFVIHTLGFLFFVAFVWLFCTYLGNNRSQGASMFVAGLLANQTGQALGSIAFFGAVVAFGPDAIGLPISLGMLYVVLIAALVFFANAGRTKRADAQGSLASNPKGALQRLASPYKLTAREVEIGALVAEGLSRAHIADKLTVSQETVKTHTKHLYQKLDVHSRTELIAFLENEGLQ